MSAQWSDEQIRMLIDERKDGNEAYHRTPNRNKRNFWEDIAEKINQAYNTNYFNGEDCNKKFLILTRAYYTAKAYKEAEANAGTSAGAGVVAKKKRSLVGEQYYEEFSTEFWKEPGRQRPNVGVTNVGTTSSNTPSRSQPSRIPRPIDTSRTGTSSKIPRAINSPNTSHPTTPSTPSTIEPPTISRPVTPSIETTGLLLLRSPHSLKMQK